MDHAPIAPDNCISTSTLIGRKDYGVKIARKYFDVNTATDEGILFNSSYPMLQMTYLVADVTELPHVEQDIVVQTSGGSSYVAGYEFVYTLEHRLGYVPLVIDLSESTKFVNRSTYMSGGWTGYSCKLEITRNRIYARVQFESYTEVTPEQKAKIPQYAKNYVQFLVTQVGIRHDVEYPYLFSPQELSANDIPTDYGVKTLLNGAEPTTEDPYNIGINLNLFPQMVLAVKTEETISDNWSQYPGRYATIYQVPDEIDYTPMYYCFKCDNVQDSYGDDVFESQNYAAQSLGGHRYFPDTRRIYQNAAYTDLATGTVYKGKTSLIVLRMPLLAAQTQEFNV